MNYTNVTQNADGTYNIHYEDGTQRTSGTDPRKSQVSPAASTGHDEHNWDTHTGVSQNANGGWDVAYNDGTTRHYSYDPRETVGYQSWNTARGYKNPNTGEGYTAREFNDLSNQMGYQNAKTYMANGSLRANMADSRAFTGGDGGLDYQAMINYYEGLGDTASAAYLEQVRNAKIAQLAAQGDTRYQQTDKYKDRYNDWLPKWYMDYLNLGGDYVYDKGNPAGAYAGNNTMTVQDYNPAWDNNVYLPPVEAGQGRRIMDGLTNSQGTYLAKPTGGWAIYDGNTNYLGTLNEDGSFAPGGEDTEYANAFAQAAKAQLMADGWAPGQSSGGRAEHLQYMRDIYGYGGGGSAGALALGDPEGDGVTGRAPSGGSGGGGNYNVQYSGSSGGGATDGSGYINDIYGAAADAALAQLKGGYDSSVLELDRNAEKLRGQYHDAENQASVQSALERLNMNEQFAALGLNTGARGQLALSQSNTLQSNISGLEQQLMQGLADIDTQRAQLSAEYQSKVAEAIANNELEKAQALYNEYVRQDEAAQSQQQYLMQLQMQSREYDLSQASSNAELARAQVDAMLKAGQVPSAALIAASGYTPEYVNAMIAAMRVSGGGGTTTMDTDLAIDYADRGVWNSDVIAALNKAGYDAAYIKNRWNYDISTGITGALPTYSELVRTANNFINEKRDLNGARRAVMDYVDKMSDQQRDEIGAIIGVELPHTGTNVSQLG